MSAFISVGSIWWLTTSSASLRQPAGWPLYLRQNTHNVQPRAVKIHDLTMTHRTIMDGTTLTDYELSNAAQSPIARLFRCNSIYSLCCTSSSPVVNKPARCAACITGNGKFLKITWPQPRPFVGDMLLELILPTRVQILTTFSRSSDKIGAPNIFNGSHDPTFWRFLIYHFI